MSPNSSPIIIAPSVLAANFGELRAESLSAQDAGADWIHIDIMDGQFVPPITFGDNIVALLRSHTKLFLDVHLMIVQPERQLDSLKRAGADRVIVHAETCPHLHRVVQNIRELGMRAGVAINPGTSVEAAFNVLDVVDLVLVMTVNPGWGGQKLLPSCLQKIAAVRSEINRRNLQVHLEVDGGIAPDTIRSCAEAGANVFVAGSAIFKQKDRAAQIRLLRKEAENGFKR